LEELSYELKIFELFIKNLNQITQYLAENTKFSEQINSYFVDLKNSF
jgi:hypothetical protein